MPFSKSLKLTHFLSTLSFATLHTIAQQSAEEDRPPSVKLVSVPVLVLFDSLTNADLAKTQASGSPAVDCQVMLARGCPSKDYPLQVHQGGKTHPLWTGQFLGMGPRKDKELLTNTHHSVS